MLRHDEVGRPRPRWYRTASELVGATKMCRILAISATTTSKCFAEVLIETVQFSEAMTTHRLKQQHDYYKQNIHPQRAVSKCRPPHRYTSSKIVNTNQTLLSFALPLELLKILNHSLVKVTHASAQSEYVIVRFTRRGPSSISSHVSSRLFMYSSQSSASACVRNDLVICL